MNVLKVEYSIACERPYRPMLEEPIATAAERIGRRYQSVSPFGVLVGDIVREHTGAGLASSPASAMAFRSSREA